MYTFSHTHTFTVPSPPRSVRVFCPVIIWGSPAESNDQIIGYEVQLTGSVSGFFRIPKNSSESYHIISDPDNSLKGSITIQVY